MKILFMIIFLIFGAVYIKPAVDHTDELYSYPAALTEDLDSYDLQDTNLISKYTMRYLDMLRLSSWVCQ